MNVVAFNFPGNQYDNTDTDHLTLMHDTKQKVNYVYFTPGKSDDDSDITSPPSKQSYSNLFKDNASFVAMNNNEVPSYKLIPSRGITPLTSQSGKTYSFYRREKNTNFIGEWEPVQIQNDKNNIVDYNIANGHSYQYIIYPSFTGGENSEQIANEKNLVEVSWDCWSITELIPQTLSVNTPTIKKRYKVNQSGIWLFKYNVDASSQTQNIEKNEFVTLGQYPKYSQGKRNNISSEITCLLGSTIVPYSSAGSYQEKPLFGGPYSTNDKVDMLNQWRKIAFSNNPKLLKDRKGQKKIVQIIANSNTPMNNVAYQPDTISFSWVEIESLENVCITGELF